MNKKIKKKRALFRLRLGYTETLHSLHKKIGSVLIYTA
ncbi:MAG: hypothetical protein KFBDDELM_00002 [Candidatus Argoarchaeum ethanivorans]|uniref:Uncharacterized protein n=1 Tax=Candidatus Argoarchaeum ethanivorans TaxID=2608793 RepID=A0A811T6B9_9EURY|nr:MAG: hypothetical protein KFBDDELM_00002 [Candidatus Argoarchaeum ethanivorans]CAD6492886.1 MAG: hypothetical protein LAKADJCE_00385 [Candidatus Argoarchaeum ethanivorans]